MYKWDLHFRILSELFFWVGAWLLCCSSVYLLEQSFPTRFPTLTVFNRTQPDILSGLDEGSKPSGNNTRSVKKSPCYDAADGPTKPSKCWWPLHAEAIGAILENTSVAREQPSSSCPFPDAIPVFQGAILQHKSPATRSLTSGVQVALNELWIIWHGVFMPKLKLWRELISVTVSFCSCCHPVTKP